MQSRCPLIALVILPALAAAAPMVGPAPFGAVEARQRPSIGSSVALRFHGVTEPVRSYPVAAPRLTGSGSGSGAAPSQLVVVRLARPGSRVKQGDLLVEFDRAAQLKASRDREAEYRDLVAQLDKKLAEQAIAHAERDLQLALAQNSVRRAELGVLGNDLVAQIVAEKNVQALEEARAHLAALRRSGVLHERAAGADRRMLEIQRERALKAWQHATRNAERMLILSPLDGLVVLKSIWKSGTMAEVQEGEEVRSGIAILEVVDPSAMRVRVLVNQADVARLSPGQPARIILDSNPGRHFAGRLEHLSPVASTSALSPRVRSFLAIFSVDGADPSLLPDLAAAVDLDGTSTFTPLNERR